MGNIHSARIQNLRQVAGGMLLNQQVFLSGNGRFTGICQS